MEIKVDEALWASSMLPEGIIEQWLVGDRTRVRSGDRIAEVRIEDALHEIVAPASGVLEIEVRGNSVIEPGTVLGRLRP